MNYAKTVPKPKLAPKTSQGEIPSSVGSRLQNHDVANLATTASFETDLSKLQVGMVHSKTSPFLHKLWHVDHPQNLNRHVKCS